MAIKGAQCNITFDLDFDKLAELLTDRADVEFSIEDVRMLWDKGGLEDVIAENLLIDDILEIADMDKYGFVNVGSGYLT